MPVANNSDTSTVTIPSSPDPMRGVEFPPSEAYRTKSVSEHGGAFTRPHGTMQYLSGHTGLRGLYPVAPSVPLIDGNTVHQRVFRNNIRQVIFSQAPPQGKLSKRPGLATLRITRL